MPTRPATHKPVHYKSRQQFDRERNPVKSAIYDRDWRKLRHAHLASNPLCVTCKAKGLIVGATEVDHITPVRQAPERRLDPSNIQSLCRSCHSRKTASEVLNRG